MKKLMISFLAGAILIGIGLGVTVLEISDWETARYPEYLETVDSNLYVIEEPVDMENLDEVKVYLSTMYRDEFRKRSMITVAEDKSCDESIVLEISYKGQEPDVYTYTYEDYSDNAPVQIDEQDRQNVKFIGHVAIHTSQYNSIADYRTVVQAMFDNKVFYENMDNCLIEGVTVRTAYPDKIKIS